MRFHLCPVEAKVLSLLLAKVLELVEKVLPQVAKVLDTRWPVHDFQPECLTGSCHVLLQSFIERIVNADQHAVIVVFLEPRLNPRVKVTK